MRNYSLIALAAFLLAALVGAILRFGLAYGLPMWVHNYLAWRHAHSHLMYFGWGTLGLMALIWHYLPHYTGRSLPKGVHYQMGFTALLALLSLPAFLPNGYGPTNLGPVALPLGSIVSGWNGLLWILFAVLYIRYTRRLSVRALPVRLWDWAIFLLMLACSGAIGLVVLIILDSPSVFLRQVMLHLFLELVAVGWFVLGLLGVLWAWIGRRAAIPERLPVASLGVVMAPTFFLGLAPMLLPDFVFWISALSNATGALLLAVHLIAFWRYRHLLPGLIRVALASLAIFVLIAFALLWPGLWHWSATTQLRVFFLHTLLLGWLSSGLLCVIVSDFGVSSRRGAYFVQMAWIVGIGAMLPALFAIGLSGVVQILPSAVWLAIAAWSGIPILGCIVWAIFSAGQFGRARHQDLLPDTPS